MTAELSISAETTNEHGLPRFVRLTVRSGAMKLRDFLGLLLEFVGLPRFVRLTVRSGASPFRCVPVFGPNDEFMGVAEVPPECDVASLVLDGNTGRLCVRT